MKKILGYFCLALTIGLLSTSVFALDCNDIFGVWNGNLGKLSSVRLYIHESDPNEDASISFNSGGIDYSYGMLKGKCKKNSDGSITLNLTRNSLGVNANLSARLTSPSQLVIESFSYSDHFGNGSGSGTLSK